ncbi:MAG: dTMP kinase [Rhodospirillaceae bacterium]|nr:MAG: dTMP kinase [Rhodospirillaceae bacterium]
MTGVFITFEGGEGGGKSTQARLLRDALTSPTRPVLLTREPGGSPGAEVIRTLLVQGEVNRWDGMTEALLLNAARCDHVRKVIRPALMEGRIVISDRFADSTLAYQGYGHGIDMADLIEIQHAAIGDFAPDLTLILDMPPEEGLRRAHARGGAEVRYENMDIAFHRRLRDGFLAIAAADPERCKVIDATRSIDAIHADVLAVARAACERAG